MMASGADWREKLWIGISPLLSRSMNPMRHFTNGLKMASSMFPTTA